MYSNFIASCAERENEIDNDKKIDLIEARISSIIDLIESFKQEYIYNVDRSVQKEIRHGDKTSRITTYDSKQKTKNSFIRSFVHSFIPSLVNSFIPSLIHSLIRSLIKLWLIRA